MPKFNVISISNKLVPVLVVSFMKIMVYVVSFWAPSLWKAPHMKVLRLKILCLAWLLGPYTIMFGYLDPLVRNHGAQYYPQGGDVWLG